MTQPHTSFDYDIVNPDASEAPVPAYPIAQWVNGKPTLKALKNIAYSGGLFLPTKYLYDGLHLPGWSPVELTFSTGKTETGLAVLEAVIAPIRTRFRWTQRRNGLTIHYPRAAYMPEAGMKGNLQVLCAVMGCADPIALTFTGKASQFFEYALKDFANKVVTPANRSAPKGRALPRYAFWLNVAPGEHEKAKAGEDAIITPPTAVLPEEASPDYIQGRYVGRDQLVAFQDWFRAAGAWATAWDKPGAEQTEMMADDMPDGYREEAEPGSAEPGSAEIPF